eukprot:1328966-Pyramimonas_sp.AAC.1
MAFVGNPRASRRWTRRLPARSRGATGAFQGHLGALLRGRRAPSTSTGLLRDSRARRHRAKSSLSCRPRRARGGLRSSPTVGQAFSNTLQCEARARQQRRAS